MDSWICRERRGWVGRLHASEGKLRIWDISAGEGQG